MFQLQGPIPADGDIDLSADGLSRLIAARTGRSDIQVKAVHWTSAFTMNARLADQYRRGRIVLVGDAAHVHPPTGGQGLNTSVQDSYNLGWKLAAALRGAPEALLDTYEEERRPIAAEMLGLATRLLGAQGQGDTRRGREVHQLDLGYAGASLARFPTRDRGGLGAGDRAPDAQLRGAGGQAARLFELFKGPHWTLLASGTGHERAAARPGLHIHAAGEGGDLIDDQDRLRDVYGLEPGDWALIRPDGYVAAIGGVSHLKDLETYLLGVGLRRVA